MALLGCLFVGAFHVAVELLLVGGGDHVPDFCAALVVVVYGVYVQVLDVPAERGEFHADVDPRDRDAADFLVAQGADSEQ